MIAFKRRVKTAIDGFGFNDGCLRQKGFCFQASLPSTDFGSFFFVEKLPD
jgi:hypothetical protein